MIVYAPYPFVEEVIILPNPQLANQETLQDERDYRVSMDKTVHSYVKRTAKHLHIYNFLMTRHKAELFEVFIQKYLDKQWRILDHHNTELIGHLVSNPFVLQFSGSHTGDCIDGYSHNERGTVEIEFEA